MMRRAPEVACALIFEITLVTVAFMTPPALALLARRHGRDSEAGARARFDELLSAEAARTRNLHALREHLM